MQAYLYDNENYYLGSTTLQESPLEPGIYFDQPNSTRIAPPVYGENEIPYWNGSWEIKPDYSGKPYYSKIDKSEKRFNRGEAFDSNYTALVPPPEVYVIWQGSAWGVDPTKKSEYDKQQCKNMAKSKLAQSDWTQAPDVNLTNKSEFATYREKLRDLVFNPVDNPVWPVEPEEKWG